jgi:hypothetical protein
VVKGVIAVLGSFDTWSYIDYVSRVVAKNGYIARTSRYEYAFDEQLRRVIRVVFHPAPGETMIHFLKDTVIGMSDAAIVIYSVPAGHYNEVHWCAELKKETLGIAFVRDVEEKNYKTGRSCSELSVSHDKTFSVCKGGIMKPAWTGWDCVRSDPCPFKKQGISINQLEYFHQNHSFMHLFAVEEIQNVDKIISDFLNGTLKYP